MRKYLKRGGGISIPSWSETINTDVTPEASTNVSGCSETIADVTPEADNWIPEVSDAVTDVLPQAMNSRGGWEEPTNNDALNYTNVTIESRHQLFDSSKLPDLFKAL